MAEKGKLRIALAGNPNSGKTTLFNALTGSNQFVGNWPGVTVEKKEGKLKKHDDVIITDLPGIYSLSPYTLEEVVARNYLLGERPDAILNIIDGTNLERNLYLTTQLVELGIPTVIAINMMDVVEKNEDMIDVEELSRQLGCPIVKISALKGRGVAEAAEEAIKAAQTGKTLPQHTFSGPVEHVLAHIEEAAIHDMPLEQQRWFAIKIFERDEKAIQQLRAYDGNKLSDEVMSHIEKDIQGVETELDDDSESIITNERYVYIAEVLKGSYKKKRIGGFSASDKIDRIVTNRFAALPIFVLVMWIVYYVSIGTVGTWATDWTNDGLFGDGWHFLGMGTAEYEEAITDYAEKNIWTEEIRDIVDKAATAHVIGAEAIQGAIEEGDFGAFEESYGTYGPSLTERGYDISEAVDAAMEEAPDTSEFGVWVPGIPVLAESGLDAIGCSEWLKGLILSGIIGGVGAVLGFVPQMLVLFLFLAFLESCGYMARIAFVMDRIFRKFGLSGKSFIPMLIGTGCSVPAIMASRTIENEKDRRMTIMTTSFIPCGAKVPIIGLISGALFGGAAWIATSAYFLGVAAVIISGIILKKTHGFAGDPAPFVMELPAYHWPTLGNILRSMWERGWSFIKKAGTIILLASVLIWVGSTWGIVDGAVAFDAEMELENSFLGIIGAGIGWIFNPLGFGGIKATVATIMGLVAKEEVVAVFGVLDFEGMSPLAGYSFLAFNLLCAPCFAAIGAIKREMNSAKWTWFALGYQTLLAYCVSLMIFQLGSVFMGKGSLVGAIAAAIVAVFGIYMLVRPYKEAK